MILLTEFLSPILNIIIILCDAHFKQVMSALK